MFSFALQQIIYISDRGHKTLCDCNSIKLHRQYCGVLYQENIRPSFETAEQKITFVWEGKWQIPRTHYVIENRHMEAGAPGFEAGC